MVIYICGQARPLEINETNRVSTDPGLGRISDEVCAAPIRRQLFPHNAVMVARWHDMGPLSVRHRKIGHIPLLAQVSRHYINISLENISVTAA